MTERRDGSAAVLVRIVESAADVALDRERGSTCVAGREGSAGAAERLPAVLADAASIVGVVPRIERTLSCRLAEATSGDLAARIVLTGRARTRLTGPVRLAIRSRTADRGVDLYTHDGDSPVGVLLVDDRAVIGLFDDRGLAAVLSTDEPAVREWAADTCRRYLAAAEPL